MNLTKIINTPKKNMHKVNFLNLVVFLLILAGSFASCTERNEKHCIENECNFCNPLTDLPWLKEKIDFWNHSSSGILVNVYQCTYNDNIDGFYIEPCLNCFVPFAYLYSCEGITMCYINEMLIINEIIERKNWNSFFEEWNINNLELIWSNIKQ